MIIMSNNIFKLDVFRMKVFGGEFGIIVIGALSAWLIHTGKLKQVNNIMMSIIVCIQYKIFPLRLHLAERDPSLCHLVYAFICTGSTDWIGSCMVSTATHIC
jgi:hypothetical protein